MNIKVKLFLLFTLLATFCFAQESIKTKEIYLSYEKYPSRVFTNQKFQISLKAVILKEKDSFDNIILTFHDQKNIDIITQKPIFNEIKSSIYATNISFKAKDKQFTMPTITLALLKNDEIVEFISLDPIYIKYEYIAINQEMFSNVIADDLKINSINTKQYSNNMLLSTIHIKATNSNLEDIHLSQYKDQGIKDIVNNNLDQEIYYYLIYPIHKKELQFTYYNVNLKEFIKITLPVSLEADLVSTQTDLNPYNSNILVYKQVAAIFMLFIICLIYYFKRYNIYLFFITINIIIIAYLFIPNKKVILNSNIDIYILPTTNSTIYKTTTKKELVEIINTKDNFTKVLFKDQKIGWIKNENI